VRHKKTLKGDERISESGVRPSKKARWKRKGKSCPALSEVFGKEFKQGRRRGEPLYYAQGGHGLLLHRGYD